MAVAFDAVASTSVAGSGGTTLSWTHTPVGTPTAVAVGLEIYTGVSTVTGITYNGVSMIRAFTKAITAATTSVEIWGLANPSSGAQTVIITFSAGSSYCQAGSITVTGSDTTTTFSASASAEGTGTTPSVSVTSAINELIVDVVGTAFVNGTQTAGGSQTKRWGTLDAGTNSASGSTLPASAGSTSMSWTLGSSLSWGHGAASFKVSGGGGGSRTAMYLPGQLGPTVI